MSTSQKSLSKLVETRLGVLRPEWADKNKPRMRRVDQRTVDRLLLSDKLTSEQHKAAEWYHNLAATANTTPHLVSQIGSMRVDGAPREISNRQADARITLKLVDADIKLKNNDYTLRVLRSVVIFDESMRNLSKDDGLGKNRTGVETLRLGLDTLEKIMPRYQRYL